MSRSSFERDSDLGQLSVIGTAIVVAIFLFIAFIIGGFFLMPYLYAIPLFAAVLIVSYLFILRKICNWHAYRKTWIVTSSLLIGGTLLYAAPSYYADLIRIDQQVHVELAEYEPFREGTKAVALDKEASFKMEEPLLKIDGATALYPVYASFAQAVYPEDTYEFNDSVVESTQTGNAYDRLIKGDVDLIFVAGPSDSHQQLAEKHGKELVLTPIGREAFVFFVNERNKVSNLTVDELRQIYSGKITNWKEVGGKNQTIRPFQREENSGSQTAMQHFMGETSLIEPIEENVVDLMGGIIDEVADYKNYKSALGYTFRFYSTTMIGDHSIRLLDVDGVSPTVEHIQDGSYPITDEFYIVTAESENPNLEPFMDWVLSEEGQQLIEKSGYVPLTPIK